MARSLYWADSYVEKQKTAEAAIAMIRPGKRVYIGSASGEPQELVRALSAAAVGISGLEIVRLMSRETTSLSEIADKTRDHSLNIRTIYLGSADTEGIARYMRFITPINMSEVPGLFLSRKMPIHVALVQVSPPDDFGWMSLGVSVDVTLAAAQSADLVIAQVNPRMPRTMGQSFIHVNNVHVIVEHEEPILSVNLRKKSGPAEWIGRHIARFVDDGSTLQIGLDAASQATVKALAEKNDLGFHSQYITDDVMHLYAAGVITNRQKGLNDGKLVASCAIGSHNLYEFLHDNPGVDFRPSDYVNDPFIISQHNRMISMNVAHTMDLTGQTAAEASEHTFFAGVSGIPDFVRGAKRSKGGKSILMLYSTSRDGKRSNIVPALNGPAVVVPRGDVHYVVTEYGAVNLSGKSLQERVLAMIGIAHPDHREWLFDAAKEAGSSAVSAVWERPPGGFIRFTWKRLSYGTAKRSPSGRPNRSTNAGFRSTTTAWTKRMCSCDFSTTKSASTAAMWRPAPRSTISRTLPWLPWWASSASARWWGSASTCCSWKAIRPRWPFPSPRNTRARAWGNYSSASWHGPPVITASPGWWRTHHLRTGPWSPFSRHFPIRSKLLSTETR
jgi:acyl-CoA hydrolase